MTSMQAVSAQGTSGGEVIKTWTSLPPREERLKNMERRKQKRFTSSAKKAEKKKKKTAFGGNASEKRSGIPKQSR